MSPNSWIRDHGWWLPAGGDGKPTHLLLDGGKALVHDDRAGDFLNAYALAVVKRQRPCVVELRTPVFRLFMDLDIHSQAPLEFGDVMTILQSRAAAFFEVDEPRGIVCSTEAKTCDDGTVKSGKHVLWPAIHTTSATAMSFRAAVVDDLEAAMPDACVKPWKVVVDACVFTSNGLRMPFSEKGRGNTATYVPTEVWSGREREEVGEVVGVRAVQQWVHELSIRAFGKMETAVRDGVVVQEDAAVAGGAGGGTLAGISKSLAEYADVLPKLDAVLPIQFAGQRFTGIIKAESCFLLKSSSRYCLNMGRMHNSCGIYWILTQRGVRQACYCRCETTEGRKEGLCKDFKSDIWPVPDDVLIAFFGSAAPSTVPEFKPEPMPSAKSIAAISGLDKLLARSRLLLKKPARKRKKPGAR